MRRTLAQLALAALVAASASRATADDARPTLEYPVKAAYLVQFARFIEWPVADAADAFEIGVVGPDPFGTALERATLGKMVAGRPLTVRRFATAEDVRPCHILFVSGPESARLSRILKLAGTSAVLTVGEGREFLEQGGMVGFFVEGNHVGFEVNLAATEASGLRVSSRMLGVAKVYDRRRTERAR